MGLTKEKIEQDMKSAMKERASIKVGVLRMLLADIHNLEIQKKADLQEADLIKVLSQSVKRHEDSVAQFTAGGRAELAASEQAELAIIQSYLPKSLAPDEVKAIVQEVVSSFGALETAEFGKVMSAVMAKVKGQARGEEISQMVKEQLQKNGA